MTYDRWLQSAAEEQYADDEPYGYIRKDLVVDQEYCVEMVLNLIDAVYMTGNIDTIENSLGGLVREFHGMGYPVAQISPDAVPVIKRGVFESFAKLTQCYAESLTKKGM